MEGVVARHYRACEGFSAIVARGDGRWGNPSPCTDWDARGVVEHVIAFHDVLLTRPMGTKPTRPKDDPAARWRVSVPAIFSAIDMLSSGHTPTDAAHAVDIGRLLPALTTDVLVHTWDLAKAICVEPDLHRGLCVISLEAVRANDDEVRSSGMFDPAQPPSADADPTAELVAFLGRDPAWKPPRRPL